MGVGVSGEAAARTYCQGHTRGVLCCELAITSRAHPLPLTHTPCFMATATMLCFCTGCTAKASTVPSRHLPLPQDACFAAASAQACCSRKGCPATAPGGQDGRSESALSPASNGLEPASARCRRLWHESGIGLESWKIRPFGS